jgi:hypothetical protein
MNALVTMKQAVDQCEQNWARFYQDTVDFHRKNAVSWLNTALGEDVSMQIDPAFSLAAWIGKQTKQTDLP